MTKNSVIGVMCLGLLLTACGDGNDDADRSAAAAEEIAAASADDTTAAPAAASADDTADDTENPVELFQLGVRVCVANDSNKDIRINWLRPERPGQDRLRPGESRCDGGRYDFATEDVAITILWDDNLRSTFSFNNPTIGAPTVTQDPGQSSAASACGIGDIDVGDWGGLGFSYDCFDAYDEGATQTYVDSTGYHGLVITRGADNDVDKQFAVSVRQ